MFQSGLSPAYKRANDAFKKAHDHFTNVSRWYREGTLTEKAFLEAQIEYKVATKRFNEAFEKEHRRTSKCVDGSVK